MLRQSLSFFADEFSGRVTTKVMQTALAVRDVLFILIEIAPGIGVYFIAIIALAGGFALKLTDVDYTTRFRLKPLGCVICQFGQCLRPGYSNPTGIPVHRNA